MCKLRLAAATRAKAALVVHCPPQFLVGLAFSAGRQALRPARIGKEIFPAYSIIDGNYFPYTRD